MVVAGSRSLLGLTLMTHSPSKECFKCGERKILSEFYAHPRMKDGHLNKCKSCTKRDVRDRRFDPSSRDKVLAYDRKRGSRQTSEMNAEYRLRKPIAYKARTAVHNAVRSGKLVRASSCEECGADKRVEGHHDDYSKPLDVRWLCSSCHKIWHAANGEAANAA